MIDRRNLLGEEKLLRLPVSTTLLVRANTSSSVPEDDGDSSSRRTCAGGSRLCNDKQPLSVSPARNLFGAVNTYPLKKKRELSIRGEART